MAQMSGLISDSRDAESKKLLENQIRWFVLVPIHGVFPWQIRFLT